MPERVRELREQLLWNFNSAAFYRRHVEGETLLALEGADLLFERYIAKADAYALRLEHLELVTKARRDLLAVNNEAARCRRFLDEARSRGDRKAQRRWLRALARQEALVLEAVSFLDEIEGEEVRHAC